MARIPLVTRDQIAEKEKPAYDAFIQGRAGRPNVGPYSLLRTCRRWRSNWRRCAPIIRDEASLPQKLQELVMISVASEMGCAFIWYAHAAAARQAGVRDDIVDSIRERRALANLDPDEQTVVDFTRELLQNRKVSQPTFDAATARFGQRGTMTLTNLIACYAVLAYNMNTYELEAPAHATEKALTGRATMTNDALRTILPVAGWSDERARDGRDHRRRRSDPADAVPHRRDQRRRARGRRARRLRPLGTAHRATARRSRSTRGRPRRRCAAGTT